MDHNDDDDDDDDDPVVDSLLVGDSFRSPDDDDEDDAEERRRKRRKRLDAIAAAKANEIVDSQTKHVIKTIAATIKPETTVRSLQTNEQEDQKKGVGSEDDDDNDDGFDMFSKSVSPLSPEPPPHGADAAAEQQQQQRGHEQQDWDDAEGYYKAVIGEELQLLGDHNNDHAADHQLVEHGQHQQQHDHSIRLRVAGVIGKGVFSTVLKCTTVSNSTSIPLPPTVAIKCIRHNESMVKAATTELEILLKLKGSPGIIPLLLPDTAQNTLEHRGHFIMVFTYMEYNLRDVLQKFGKGVGVSLQAVRSYFGQMIAAALHLQRHGIVHADLKPDNILVSNDFATIQLADFGSAIDVKVSGEDALPTTPYLVSRFYRAPEIILGLKPTYAIDLWSLAVTVAELFLGEVLFRGTSNNDMLYVFMQTLGPIPNRVIRQHVVQSKKFGLPVHFQQQAGGGGGAYYFSQDTVDAVSGTKVHKLLSLTVADGHSNQQATTTARKFPNATPLATLLRKAQAQNDARSMVDNFTDLLKQCLHLDPARRIALHDALRHGFFATATTTPST